MKDSHGEAVRWLRQAENDLDFARLALKKSFFHQACFISQQAAEKALKSIPYALGERVVLGHSLVDRTATRDRARCIALPDRVAYAPS